MVPALIMLGTAGSWSPAKLERLGSHSSHGRSNLSSMLQALNAHGLCRRQSSCTLPILISQVVVLNSSAVVSRKLPHVHALDTVA